MLIPASLECQPSFPAGQGRGLPPTHFWFNTRTPNSAVSGLKPESNSKIADEGNEENNKPYSMNQSRSSTPHPLFQFEPQHPKDEQPRIYRLGTLCGLRVILHVLAPGESTTQEPFRNSGRSHSFLSCTSPAHAKCSAGAPAQELPNLLHQEVELCLDGDPKQGKICI